MSNGSFTLTGMGTQSLFITTTTTTTTTTKTTANANAGKSFTNLWLTLDFKIEN